VEYHHTCCRELIWALQGKGIYGIFSRALLDRQITMFTHEPHEPVTRLNQAHAFARYSLRLRQLRSVHCSNLQVAVNGTPLYASVPSALLARALAAASHMDFVLSNDAGVFSQDYIRPLLLLGISSLRELLTSDGQHVIDTLEFKRRYGRKATTNHRKSLNLLTTLMHTDALRPPEGYVYSAAPLSADDRRLHANVISRLQTLDAAANHSGIPFPTGTVDAPQRVRTSPRLCAASDSDEGLDITPSSDDSGTETDPAPHRPCMDTPLQSAADPQGHQANTSDCQHNRPSHQHKHRRSGCNQQAASGNRIIGHSQHGPNPSASTQAQPGKTGSEVRGCKRKRTSSVTALDAHSCPERLKRNY
jgi:hypothetical protein